MWRKVSSLAFVVLASTPTLCAAARPGSAHPDAITRKPQDKVVATLKVIGGVVMVSSGNGPFIRGATNAAVSPGDRVLVLERSSASVTYSSGCTLTYDAPGILDIPERCDAAGAGQLARAGGALAPASTSTVVTGNSIGSVITDNPHCNCEAPPVGH